MENCHLSQHYRVRSPFSTEWEQSKRIISLRSLKTIIEALEEELNSLGTIQEEEDPQSPLHNFQTRRLGLSPLFLIESNLLKLLAPDRDDCRNMSIRAGEDWKATLYSKSKGSEVVSQEYDPTPILVAQRHDIITLWRNDETQRILANRRLTLRRSSGL